MCDLHDLPWMGGPNCLKRRSAMALAAAAVLAPGGAHAAARAFVMTEIAPGIHVRRGDYQDADRQNDDAIANIGFVVGRKGVAVIDPGGSLHDGVRLRAAIRKHTRLPIRYVVMSHVHPDHVFGAVAFQPDNPVFVGHARLPAALTARGAFYRHRLAQILGAGEAGNFVVPTLLVHDRMDIDLGGRVLTLTAHKTAHTDNDLTIMDQQTATLWAADLLFVTRIPALDAGLLGWMKVLAHLTRVPAARAVPGHGPASVPWPEAATAEAGYFSALADGIRGVLARGGDIEQAVRSVGLSERGRWRLFEAYNGRNVTIAFQELEWE